MTKQVMYSGQVRQRLAARLVALGVLVLATVAVPLLPTRVVQADGEMEAGFGANGVMIDPAFAADEVQVQRVLGLQDGSFVVAGVVHDGQGSYKEFIARYLADGRPDPSFGVRGVVYATDLDASVLAALPDGRLVTAQTGLLLPLVFVERNGSISTTTARMRAPVLQLIARPDGSVTVVDAGLGGTWNQDIKVITPDGRIDTTLTTDLTTVLPQGARPTGWLSKVNYLPDGRLLMPLTYYTVESPATPTCSAVLLGSDGQPDLTFGTRGLVTFPDHQHSGCTFDPFAGGTIRLRSFFNEPGYVFDLDGQVLGTLDPPFDTEPVEVEGTGYFYMRGGAGEVLGYDPQGNLDPTFGLDGMATVPGVDIKGLALLDPGDLLTWGTPTGDTRGLALGLVHASYGTAAQPPLLDTAAFVPLTPKRILDTRDGTGASSGALAAGSTVDVSVPDAVGTAADDIAAVVLNVTATEATQAGYVTAYPSGTHRPWSSNLNFDASDTVANLVTVGAGEAGRVTLFSSASTQLIADIAGYYTFADLASDGRFQVTTPQRILDTRIGLGAPQAKVGASGQIDLRVAGAVPVPAAGAEAVILNVTGADATFDGFITVWPAGTPRPLASNLNLTAGKTRANLVVVSIGADGKVSLFSSGGTDLIADVAGWFTDDSAEFDSVGLFVPITPTRLLDTRNEPAFHNGAGTTVTRRIGSTRVVPPDAAMAVAVNITATATLEPGYITAWAGHTPRPMASNVNAVRAGQTVPNAVVSALGEDDLSVFTQAGAHIVIDIGGWYTNF